MPLRSFRLLLALALLSCASAPVASAERPKPLPDTETSRFKGYAAWLVEPTLEYDHGALGDPIEAKGLVITRGNQEFFYRLPSHTVFEDRKVRLDDLNGDGRPEALVVRSDALLGAGLALFTLTDSGIELMAESKPIGKPHRWLNPVGIAKFAGSGENLVAAVVTPHLTGSLRFYRIDGNRLVDIGGLDGVTNHILGTRNLDLARIADVDRDGAPDIVLPSLDRRSLVAVTFSAGRARIIRHWAAPSRIVAVDPVKGGRTVLHLVDKRQMPVDLAK